MQTIIRFYKSRLPFVPRTNQVIYFDHSMLSMKSPELLDYFTAHYDEVYNLFRRANLEFCFLPVLAPGMQIRKIYRYFNPNAGEVEIYQFEERLMGGQFLQYIAADAHDYDSTPGLVRYLGTGFDTADCYVFSYTSLRPDRQDGFMLGQLYAYIDRYGVNDAFKGGGDVSINQDGTMSEVERMVEIIRNSNIGNIVLRQLIPQNARLSRLRINGSRIFMTDYGNLEITMPALSKALFLFYLRHPEGVPFKYLADYQDELYHIYASFASVEDVAKMRQSISDMVNPFSNSVNEKASRVKRAFTNHFDDTISRFYYITGRAGEAKRIVLPRDLVEWK